MRGAKCEVRGARYEVRGAKCEVRGAKYEVRSGCFFEITIFRADRTMELSSDLPWLTFTAHGFSRGLMKKCNPSPYPRLKSWAVFHRPYPQYLSGGEGGFSRGLKQGPCSQSISQATHRQAELQKVIIFNSVAHIIGQATESCFVYPGLSRTPPTSTIP